MDFTRSLIVATVLLFSYQAWACKPSNEVPLPLNTPVMRGKVLRVGQTYFVMRNRKGIEITVDMDPAEVFCAPRNFMPTLHVGEAVQVHGPYIHPDEIRALAVLPAADNMERWSPDGVEPK